MHLMKKLVSRRTATFAIGAALLGIAHAADSPSSFSPAQREFFETRIRPVLAQDCYECHASVPGGKRKGGLAVDHRRALMKGGDSGPVIIPGDPQSSLLMRAIRHSDEDLKMPKSGAKLEDRVLADFEEWISMGAPDPREAPPSAEVLAQDTDWEAVMERRKRWWSFRPLGETALGDLPEDEHAHPVDRFIRARLDPAKLEPAGPADPHTLLRRLSFVLRGLPPTPEEIEQFTRDPSQMAYTSLVNQFLDSPQFGERWARHWMDWIRYADSHGSEGDPAIPYAWRFRDYLIRALNSDVSYDQLVREHLAGDLMESPRINRDLGLNESAIGPAHLRMVFHGFAPTDALDEQVRFTDDQINVVSKAFLGLTVSCARCHDHKFDPISQRDFYGWYGIFASCPPASIAVDAPSEESKATRTSMTALKSEIQAGLIEAWMEGLPELEERLAEGGDLDEAVAQAKDLRDLLHPLWVAREGGNVEKTIDSWRASNRQTNNENSVIKQWNFKHTKDLKDWRADGNTASQTSRSGVFAIAPEGEDVLTGIYPAGVYSHLISEKDRAVLLSPRFELAGEYDLWMELAGDGGAFMRYAVQNYPRNGTVYPVGRLNDGHWRWQRYGLDYWKGDFIHVELTTAADQPVLADTGADRSWIGVRRVVITKKGQSPPRNEHAFALPLTEAYTPDLSLNKAYQSALNACLTSWQNNILTDSQALFLGKALRAGLLPNTLDELPSVIQSRVATYREKERSLPIPTRAPGVLEKDAYDQPLFHRGNHKDAGEPVPRHFLDALDGRPYQTPLSGRQALAQDFFRADNPLSRRVIVNRIWHHVFGEGLVRTPDNLGRLGEKPSHPRLLDHLAIRFEETGYSIKELIRYLVTSSTWKAASTPSDLAAAIDPDNRLLSHAPVRRLEAEAIRDTLLAVAGELDRETMHGPPVRGDSPRRSVYLRVKRNDLDPFLSTFDAPVPASTKGRRDVTNVPSQSLTLLNDAFVIRMANDWAEALESVPERDRIPTMFLQGLGRLPSAEETRAARQFLDHSLEEARVLENRQRSLSERESQLTSELAKLTETVKNRVLAKRGQTSPAAADRAAASLPQPIASWNFDGDLQDAAGTLHGKAHGSAHVAGGHLVLNGKAGNYVSTPPLDRPLREKTLEAWVKLDNLRQQGGGVLSVQDLKGITFDAIVFGEQKRGHWMAGSDGFRRTESFEGGPENQAVEQFVHIAIVYAADGSITGYRQGKRYGKSYQSRGPVPFGKGSAQVLFGNRHGEPTGNHMLGGRIDKAALYDRALTEEDIAASASGDPNHVSRAQQVAAMSGVERARETSLKEEISALQSELKALDSDRAGPTGWADLAHALFNLKEFLYIR